MQWALESCHLRSRLTTTARQSHYEPGVSVSNLYRRPVCAPTAAPLLLEPFPVRLPQSNNSGPLHWAQNDSSMQDFRAPLLQFHSSVVLAHRLLPVESFAYLQMLCGYTM
jgi:hypothetical protein